jgi:seryl-tRNA synthetase
VLDLRWVVGNIEETKRRLSTRGPQAAAALAPIEQLASERKALIQATETRRAEQKKASEQMRTLRGSDRSGAPGRPQPASRNGARRS